MVMKYLDNVGKENWEENWASLLLNKDFFNHRTTALLEENTPIWHNKYFCLPKITSSMAWNVFVFIEIEIKYIHLEIMEKCT